MREVALDPPYTPLTQQRMCCVPCAVQWVLLRRGLPIFTQEKIGEALDLTVPPVHKKLFCEGVMVSITEPAHGWGSKTDGHDALNKFFKENRLPVRARHVKHSALKKPEDLIERNIKKGNDVMFITFMGVIDKKYRWGHALVVSALKREKEPVVTVGDPNFVAPKFYDLPLSLILKGMSARHGKAERGLYIFSTAKR
ncbi:MAG: hypothetical protein HYS26_04190 [Candidatus Kaiserbacteria bacterium]|nr:MAG: hypothetical protein HYS26_04190 [Candidatus Kaiserbacteria bacterium]